MIKGLLAEILMYKVPYKVLLQLQKLSNKYQKQIDKYINDEIDSLDDIEKEIESFLMAIFCLIIKIEHNEFKQY